ncbi:MAG TPA: phosphonate metabolism protein/1,5-bisphosphokinase (PRPP-forming) PhnN [Devosiaceae bacterium]
MLVLVVGPSGAGKDTLINAGKAALADDARFVFPRRVVTRQAMAALEDHESTSLEDFERAEASGAYALSWGAHGLRYGLPAALVDDLKAGRTVVFNGSRAMVATAVAKFPGTRVVLIEATAAVRAKRLSGRGRETEAEVAARLAREVPAALPDAIRIDNSGALDDGIASFVMALRSLARD